MGALRIRKEVSNFCFLNFILQSGVRAPSVLIVFVAFGRGYIRVFMGVLFGFLMVFLLGPSRARISRLRFRS